MPTFVKTEIIKQEFINNPTLKKEFIKKHVLWIKKLKKAGIEIRSGFLVNHIQKPGAGGLLIIKANSFKDALEIVKEDPMIKGEIVEWKLNEWIDISLK